MHSTLTKVRKSLSVLLFAFCLVGLQTRLAQCQSNTENPTKFHDSLEKMPTTLEVRFALSALPVPLREKASVYVLDPVKGYVLERAGSNGQSCFVGRTEWKFGDYRNDVYDPVCYDAVGASTYMRVWFDVAELRAKGVSPEAMKKEIETRFLNGTYALTKHPTDPDSLT
jgi:hypothetical protein